MKTTTSRFSTVAMGVLAILYVTGCESGKNGSSVDDGSSDSLNASLHTYDINAYPANKVVCNPMGGTGDGTLGPKLGIKTELFYKSQNQPRYYRAADYINFSTKSDQTIFLSDMFVPTRYFDVGFTSQSNSVLKDDSGQRLIEFFGLRMNTTIRLTSDQPEGIYEFALISDDGSIMKIKNPATDSWMEILNNDGDHPARMGCSTERVTMTRSTKLETQVLYYQGPRTQIANVLLWRKIDPNTQAGQDSACGQVGNEHWFRSATSAPTANYNALLARGWSTLSAKNFYVPDESTETVQYNPCTEGTTPIVSNLQITEMVSTDIWVRWNTDIPSTAQLMITNVATGSTVITQTDNVLRSLHYIHHSGLQARTAYQLRVINTSADLGRTVSAAIDFTTP